MKKKLPKQLKVSTSLLSLSLSIVPNAVNSAQTIKDTLNDENHISPRKVVSIDPLSIDLAKLLKPKYRNELYDKANELKTDVLRRALCSPSLNNGNSLPQVVDQPFGDTISFQDSWSNGDTWQDVFANSGR